MPLDEKRGISILLAGRLVGVAVPTPVVTG